MYACKYADTRKYADTGLIPKYMKTLCRELITRVEQPPSVSGGVLGEQGCELNVMSQAFTAQPPSASGDGIGFRVRPVRRSPRVVRVAA